MFDEWLKGKLAKDAPHIAQIITERTGVEVIPPLDIAMWTDSDTALITTICVTLFCLTEDWEIVGRSKPLPRSALPNEVWDWHKLADDWDIRRIMH